MSLKWGRSAFAAGASFLSQDPLGAEAGSINYDPVKGIMNVRNIFADSSIQVGHEAVTYVINNTGSPIPDGKIVNISGFDVANDAFEINLAIADSLDNITQVVGMTTVPMEDGEFGLVTIFGRINNLDTTDFSPNDEIFLSDTVAGGITNVSPDISIHVGHVGVVDDEVGFIQILPKEVRSSIYAGLSSSIDQTFGDINTSQVITFNAHSTVKGIAHSNTVDNSEITILSSGVYQFNLEPQIDRTSGSSPETMSIWAEKDTGSGFVAIPNTAIKVAAGGAGDTDISPLTVLTAFSTGDKVRFRAQVTATNLLLQATAAAGDIPLTPSVILNVSRVGP